jgi:hypothetical protein
MFECGSRDENPFPQDLATTDTKTARHQIAKCDWIAGGTRRHRSAPSVASCRVGLSECGAYRSVDTSRAVGRKERDAPRPNGEVMGCASPAGDLSCSDPPPSTSTFARVVSADDRFLTRKAPRFRYAGHARDVARKVTFERPNILMRRSKMLCLRTIYMLQVGCVSDRISLLNKSATKQAGERIGSE